MTHIVREVVRPGQYTFKVYCTRGALLYYGSSESIALSIKLKEEKKNATATSSNDGKRTTGL